MGICNYCTLKRIELAAKARCQKVIVHRSAGKLGGFNVYTVGMGTETVTDEDFSAWLMAVPKKCAC